MEGRDNFSAAEKKRMKLSQDTLDGLRMTGQDICHIDSIFIMCTL